LNLNNAIFLFVFKKHPNIGVVEIGLFWLDQGMLTLPLPHVVGSFTAKETEIWNGRWVAQGHIVT
jgi:hypothetical protein